VPEPGNPQAFNRYSYVGGNPLRYLDPTGHSKFTDWLIETGKKIGNSGPIGKALVVSAAEAVNHVNQQTEKVFYPDENTDPVDRFWACVEIGGVATLAAAPIAYGGSWAIGALGGGATLAETGGAAATAACADGDCTNEIRAAASGVWQLNPLERGRQIHQMLGENLASNFPTIDRFFKGVATSIKSINLNAASYQNIARLTSRVTGYINNLANFQGAYWGGTRITVDQITGRVLELVIPSSGWTQAQWDALVRLQQYAAELGVTVNIVQLP